jgi:hypothetical protein
MPSKWISVPLSWVFFSFSFYVVYFEPASSLSQSSPSLLVFGLMQMGDGADPFSHGAGGDQGGCGAKSSCDK